jgi:hypothetical protein
MTAIEITNSRQNRPKVDIAQRLLRRHSFGLPSDNHFNETYPMLTGIN